MLKTNYEYDAVVTPVGLDFFDAGVNVGGTMPHEVLIRKSSDDDYVLFDTDDDAIPEANPKVIIDDITRTEIRITCPSVQLGDLPEYRRFPNSFKEIPPESGTYYFRPGAVVHEFRRDKDTGFYISIDKVRILVHGYFIEYNESTMNVPDDRPVKVEVRRGCAVIMDECSAKQKSINDNLIDEMWELLSAAGVSIISRRITQRVLDIMMDRRKDSFGTYYMKGIREYFKDATTANPSGIYSQGDAENLKTVMTIMFGAEFADDWGNHNDTTITDVSYSEAINGFIPYDANGKDLAVDSLWIRQDEGSFDPILYLRKRLGARFISVAPAAIDNCQTRGDCDSLISMVKIMSV